MDDVIRTFMLDQSGFRGRAVRLGPLLDDILGPHGYAAPAGRLTAEAAVLAALLASMLKYDGIFTLQAQGQGAVAAVVADITSGGDLRACATLREEDGDTVEGLGRGHLAFTVDQGRAADRYQGIVELTGEGLTDSVRAYFRQSEQIPTGVRIAIANEGGRWRAGGILVQRMPGEGGLPVAPASDAEDDWRRTMLLLDTCTGAELTDPALGMDDLLVRLFHEEGVRGLDEKPLRKGCRCSDGKLSGILSSMPRQDLDDMAENGVITMSCRFCNRDFVFERAAIRAGDAH